MPHTQDLQIELTLIHLWPVFPEQNQDVDGVKARFIRRQILRELERDDSTEWSS